MDITLVINPGSASKKYALFNGDTRILSVLFERVGDGYGKCVEIDTTRQKCESATVQIFESSIEETIAIAIREGVIESTKDIARVGMRIVAPGTFFETHRLLDEVYIRNLKKMEDAAPLHISSILRERTLLLKLLPEIPCIGVSDSAFHTTIPEYVRRYSIPRVDREAFDVYRFGYHGLSVSSVLHAASKILGTHAKRIVVCHVGSGVSVTAVREGKSIDTTMGFSPTSGLMMNSRSGDLDPGALLYLMKKKHLTAPEAETYVAKEGGFTGILGQSDLRIALDRSARGEVEAKIAIDMFIYQVQKAVGGSIAALGGLDALILTGTAAERNSYVRTRICKGLEGLGLLLDEKINEDHALKNATVHQLESSVKILVINTNEMGEIAKVANTFIS